MNSTMWGLVLDSFKRIVQVFFGNVETERVIIRNVALIKPTKNCLESLRYGNLSSSLYVSPTPSLYTVVVSEHTRGRVTPST